MVNQKVLISGAGIAGPCLAYWLKKYGFDLTIVERAPALRTGGYIIDFWGLGFDVAEKMKLLPALRREGYQIDEFRIVDEKGHPAGGFSATALQSVLGERYLSVLRSDLAKLIYQSLGGEVRTMFGDSITGLKQDDDGVTVQFEHAPEERFDLVFGAGGQHSPVRRLVFGPESEYQRFMGYYAASFGITGYPRREERAYLSYAAPGRQISRYTLRDDRTVFFFVFARDTTLPIEPQDLNAQKDILRTVFSEDKWEECPAIIKALDACEDLYFDSVSQIRMNSWARGRVALIGDACSSPSLLAGQGSALAMAAAYILAGELKKAGGDYRVAYAAYEHMLQPLMAKKQRAAQSFAASFAPRTKLGIFLRNHITRLMTQPFVARLLMGNLIRDPLVLPTYQSL